MLVPNLAEGEFSYPLKYKSRFAMAPDQVLEALRRCEYSVKIDHREVVRMSVPADVTLEQLREPGYVSPDGSVRVKYDGQCVDLAVCKEVKLSRSDGVNVSTFERSYISADDRTYTLSCPHPVRKFQLYFSVDGQRFRIEDAAVGPQRYWNGDDAKTYAALEGWPDAGKDHFCNVTVDRWVLPGLVLALRWAPVPPAKPLA